MTRRFVEQAPKRGDGELIFRKTASQKWTDRACKLLSIDAVRLDANDHESAVDKDWHPVPLPNGYCRDQLAIDLADRIDATYVRPGGTILRLLRQRLEKDQAATIQVLVTRAEDKAAKELIAHGAIGYWINLEGSANKGNTTSDDQQDTTSNRLNEATVIDSLLRNPDQWLIHSTRQRSGPWPGQSIKQFENWLLLSDPSRCSPSPIETLNRIVSERRIIGSHATVPVAETVVSFTALPINRWLARRAYRPHLGRWDCEPFGIAVDRVAASRLGIQPVIYGESLETSGLSVAEAWRYQAVGRTYDWSEEREWRAKGLVDLSRFRSNEVVIFVREPTDTLHLAPSDWPVVSSDRIAL